MFARARLWLRAMLLRRRLEREMQAEMREHLERAQKRLIARGLSPEDAREAALKEFGNVALLQEHARAARGWVWLDALVGDIRFARRHFAKRPFTTFAMFVVLAAGMGISTLLFSGLQSFRERPPMGIQRADDLVRIRGGRDGGPAGRTWRAFGEEELTAYRGLKDVFTAVAGWTDAQMALDAGDDPARRGLEARVTFATDDYFRVLGARPVLGAGLPASTGDASVGPVAVLGYAAWEQLFAKSSAAIGSTVRVNGVPVTIVGVAPQRFNGDAQPTRFQLWMPLAARRLFQPMPAPEFQAAARLRTGVDLSAATAATTVVAARAAATDRNLAALRPSTDVVPLSAANADPAFDNDFGTAAFLIGLLAFLVLAVTCTNVSALLTGLATARRQEIAIRMSLGAARNRLVRQLLTESAILAVAAAATSLAVVFLVLRTITRNVPSLTIEVAVTWQAVAFTFGTALAVGMLFGLAPALHATRLAVAGVLRDSSASIVAARARLQRALIVAQVALTQPLIVLVAAVLVLTLTGTPVVRPAGYQLQQRTALDRTILLEVPQSAAGATGAAHRVAERVRGITGVETAVMEWEAMPLGPYAVATEDRVAGAPDATVRLKGARAMQGYFAVTGISLLRGRELVAGDTLAAGARSGDVPTVIGAALARRLFGAADPIGRRLRPVDDTTGTARTLVVVGMHRDPEDESTASVQEIRVFVPPAPGEAPAALLVRTAGPAEPLVADVRRAAQDAAPATVIRIRTFREINETTQRLQRVAVGGMVAAGLAALLLSAIGLYAVVAFSVSQRSGEIAVRMAFGARSAQILRKFVGDGLRLSAVGIVLGLPAGVAGLYALLSSDPLVRPGVVLPYVTVIAVLGVVLVATAAVLIPARRAAAVQPAITLRRE